MEEIDRTSGYLREDLETMGRDERRAYLDKKVLEICAHAYEHSPANRAIMDKAGAPAR